MENTAVQQETCQGVIMKLYGNLLETTSLKEKSTNYKKESNKQNINKMRTYENGHNSDPRNERGCGEPD